MAQQVFVHLHSLPLNTRYSTPRKADRSGRLTFYVMTKTGHFE
jgi:hypothetical protein